MSGTLGQGSAGDRHQGRIDIARRAAHPSVMRDFHKRTGTEDELIRVVDALPGLVWTALPDGHVDFLNQRWCEYTGLSVDESYGQGWQTAIHCEDLPELLGRWRSILASGEPREMEARLRRFDGEYRWFLFRTNPLVDLSGQIVKWCGVNTDIEDRKRAKEAVNGVDRLFRSVVDGLPALVTLRTPAGDLEFANRHVLEYVGATIEELKQLPTTGTVHPDDLPNLLALWKGSVETGHPYDIEVRRRRADGVYRWFHMRGSPLRDTDGHIVIWYLLGTDVDDRNRAENLLAGEKRLLEMVAGGDSMSGILEALCQLVESTVTGCYCSVLLLGPDGTRLERGAAPSLPPNFIASIIGRPVKVDSGPCAMTAYLNEQVIATDLTAETRWAASDWCSMALAHGLQACWSTPISSTTGKVLGTFAIYFAQPRTPMPQHQILIDQFTHVASITIERAQTDAALKRSEAFLAEAQRLSSTGSFSWNTVTDKITWSEEVYHIYGLDPTVPITMERFGSRLHPDDVAHVSEHINRARGDGRDFEVDYRTQMDDHSVKYLHAVVHAGRDQDGQLEYFGAVQDVTERRLSEQALSKLRSDLAHIARVTSLGALTASIAHEVNQPLSGIITNASTCLRMLAADPPNIDGARETARRTIRDGNRASDVITRLRALFSKKDASTESVDLNEATREVIALSLSELQRNQVILRPELGDDLPPVTGDRVQLQQVILNLLLNASDAMGSVNDRPRQLIIKTERDEGDRVRLTVQDAGVGLEPQGVDKLFEAFYTTKSDGMGIGLSISRSIIESHHGRLWAAPNDGPGATFSFSIPRGSPSDMTGVHNLDPLQTPAVKDAQRIVRNP